MKNYLIIGGSSGIGLQSVKLLEGKGHNIYATYNSAETPYHGTNVRYFRHNVLEDENTLDDLLPDAIDGLVYCPGTLNLKPFHRIKPETFREDYDLQVIGAIKTIQAVLARLTYQIVIDGGEAYFVWHTESEAKYYAAAYEGGTGFTYASDPSRVTHRGPLQVGTPPITPPSYV